MCTKMSCVVHCTEYNFSIMGVRDGGVKKDGCEGLWVWWIWPQLMVFSPPLLVALVRHVLDVRGPILAGTLAGAAAHSFLSQVALNCIRQIWKIIISSGIIHSYCLSGTSQFIARFNSEMCKFIKSSELLEIKERSSFTCTGGSASGIFKFLCTEILPGLDHDRRKKKEGSRHICLNNST